MCQAAGEEQLLKKVKDCLSISNENLCSFLVRVLSNFLQEVCNNNVVLLL